MQINAPEKGILALGQGIKRDGTLAIHSKKVVEKVVELVRKERYSFVTFSGGSTFRAGFAPPISEAEAMQEEFYRLVGMLDVTIKIPPVLVETKSKDTLSNFAFSRRILEDLDIRDIVIVTPKHHGHRAGKIGRFVLGTKYKITSQHAQDVLTREEVDRIWYAERESLNCTYYLLNEAHIKLGDYRKIIRNIMQTNPAFNPNAKVSPEVKRRMDIVTQLRKGINKYSDNPD